MMMTAVTQLDSDAVTEIQKEHMMTQSYKEVKPLVAVRVELVFSVWNIGCWVVE